MIAASQSLRLETAQAEANHAEAKCKVEELKRQYDAYEWAALADFNEKSRAIDAKFERQIANVAAQPQPSLCDDLAFRLGGIEQQDCTTTRTTGRFKRDPSS
jgi:hypothetical protein